MELLRGLLFHIVVLFFYLILIIPINFYSYTKKTQCVMITHESFLLFFYYANLLHCSSSPYVATAVKRKLLLFCAFKYYFTNHILIKHFIRKIQITIDNISLHIKSLHITTEFLIRFAIAHFLFTPLLSNCKV